MKNIDTNLPKFFGHVPVLTAYKCSIPPIRKCNNNLKKNTSMIEESRSDSATVRK